MYLLDPGAGQGALCRAFFSRWKESSLSFQDGRLDAFDIDPDMLSSARKILETDKDAIPLSLNFIQGDFIEQAVIKILNHERPYSHAILNPPYRKINSSSRHRKLLRDVGIETVNLYSAFVALSVAMLAKGGQIVAIVPRSFCNGPYYRPFRQFILSHTSILHIHLFESRNKAFEDDGILQENVILALERDAQQGDVVVSTSTDGDMLDYTATSHCFSAIVNPGDPESFFRIPANGGAPQAHSNDICHTLSDIGIEVSTGPVVDFRMKDYLHRTPEGNDAPLLYPAHFRGHGEWPIAGFKRFNAIRCCPETVKLLYPNGYYVVVRRMSSKEEKRRIVASVVDPSRFHELHWLGFDNHLNVFHSRKRWLPGNVAHGLATFLNSSFIDSIVRRFNGHTQVNATDLRALRYPPRITLARLGLLTREQDVITQDKIDRFMEMYLE
ncbi:MAG: Eco57I restriction-modification methylase domain-containing protein [Deltaproteobacteria bacterium]|jgi:adenine-specific DNA-methyltransferase|nr:Eco57I restriction-modification methylase domain-containing protein [Deltaproteobacteria bacterium]